MRYRITGRSDDECEHDHISDELRKITNKMRHNDGSGHDPRIYFGISTSFIVENTSIRIDVIFRIVLIDVTNLIFELILTSNSDGIKIVLFNLFFQ